MASQLQENLGAYLDSLRGNLASDEELAAWEEAGWSWKSPFKKIGRGLKKGLRATGRGLAVPLSVLSQVRPPGGTLMGDIVEGSLQSSAMHGKSPAYAKVLWKNGRVSSVPLNTLNLHNFKRMGTRSRSYYVQL